MYPLWFLDKIADLTLIRGSDECWEWIGARNAYGYPAVRSPDGRTVGVHRVVTEIATGEPLGKFYALHSCDNRGCVNPGHLRRGTAKENSADMVARRRSSKGKARKQIERGEAIPTTIPTSGERNGRSRLTEDAVREIRRLYAQGVSQNTLAETFGVSGGMISKVLNRVNWAHVA